MRAIDDFPVEVLITLALVAGTYALAQKLGTSGPLAVVAAGLLIGERAPRYAMSKRTRTYVSALWTLIDEVLNSVLFLLIGLEVLVLTFDPSVLGLAAAAVPIVLFARVIAVLTPLALFLVRSIVGAQCAVPDLGGPPRRHFRCARLGAAGEPVEIGDPCGDLRGGFVYDRRAGLDARHCRAADVGARWR